MDIGTIIIIIVVGVLLILVFYAIGVYNNLINARNKAKENKNVVVISEQEYNELQRAKRNAEYLAKLDRSFAQLKKGEVIMKSMEELEHMADE